MDNHDFDYITNLKRKILIDIKIKMKQSELEVDWEQEIPPSD